MSLWNDWHIFSLPLPRKRFSGFSMTQNAKTNETCPFIYSDFETDRLYNVYQFWCRPSQHNQSIRMINEILNPKQIAFDAYYLRCHWRKGKINYLVATQIQPILLETKLNGSIDGDKISSDNNFPRFVECKKKNGFFPGEILFFERNSIGKSRELHSHLHYNNYSVFQFVGFSLCKHVVVL